MKKRPLDSKRKLKMLDNVSEYLKIESTSNTTRNILSLLQSNLKTTKYLIDLKPNELRILLSWVSGDMKVLSMNLMGWKVRQNQER